MALALQPAKCRTRIPVTAKIYVIRVGDSVTVVNVSLSRVKNVTLRENRADHVSMDVGESEMTALELISELGVIHTEAVENRGVQIVDFGGIFHDVVAEIVGLSMGDPAFNSAACHPH